MRFSHFNYKLTSLSDNIFVNGEIWQLWFAVTMLTFLLSQCLLCEFWSAKFFLLKNINIFYLKNIYSVRKFCIGFYVFHFLCIFTLPFSTSKISFQKFDLMLAFKYVGLFVPFVTTIRVLLTEIQNNTNNLILPWVTPS